MYAIAIHTYTLTNTHENKMDYHNSNNKVPTQHKQTERKKEEKTQQYHREKS